MMICTLFLVAALVSLGSFEPIREPERHQVVIVGAGVSGISAAVTLLEHNVTDIIVLEASNRVGGRINTTEFGGVTIERGAEFVHGEKRNTVYEMISSFDFLMSMKNVLFKPENIIYTNIKGDKLNSTFVLDMLVKTSDILESLDIENKNISVSEYFEAKMEELLQDNNVEKELGEGIRSFEIKNVGILNSVANISELGPSVDYESAEGDQSLTWKQGSGGYKKLFEILMKRFPDAKEELPLMEKIVLDKQVTQIKYGDNKPVEVQCADGSTYLADHVIVTVSLGVLKKHADTMFVPALPERKTATIKSLGFGVVGKVFLLFPNKWWPENINSVVPMLSNQEEDDLRKNTVHGHWMVDALGFFPVLGNDRMLKAWFYGNSCRTMESLSEEQVLEGVTEFMEYTLGKIFNVTKPEKILKTSWATNPFTLGSYSFHSVDSDKQNLKNKDLEAPIIDNNKPVVLFAGEATHSHFYSTVHGALETGRREAKRIIDFYKDKTN